MCLQLTDLKVLELDDTNFCYFGRIPDDLNFTEVERDALWAIHPEEFQLLTICGRSVPTPRWQQAYGRDYEFSRQVSLARPVPRLLNPLLSWVQEHVDTRINGILVNWYDDKFNHYIGPHRDAWKRLCEGAPIVMVSFGSDRIMRFRRWKGRDRRDVVVTNGHLCILPFATNLAWTHEVLHRSCDRGRRISVTLRAFNARRTKSIDDRSNLQ